MAKQGENGISWTDETWNPVRGCSRVSEGCRNCYAETQAIRIIGMDRGRGVPEGEGAYDGLIAKGGQWNGKMKTVPELLSQPLRWQKPRLIFVNSMSDLFHEGVPDSYIQLVFAVMAVAQHHTFQILTKRPERMRKLLERKDLRWIVDGLMRLHEMGLVGPNAFSMKWPLPNVWLGVSVEDQIAANARIHMLLETPAAVRWLSMEPLLGKVDLTRVMRSEPDSEWTYCDNVLDGYRAHKCGGTYAEKLDWVVVGGESGANARPMHIEWVRKLRDQCAEAGTPFHFKQWGEWAPGLDTGVYIHPMEGNPQFKEQCHSKLAKCLDADGYAAVRMGKRNVPRVLDGVFHDAYPKVPE